jgi:Mysoin-binding motif of peroxisomes
MIQEIELVSRGYRITTPLAPISRIEQNSKHRRCQEARKKLYILLNRAIFKLNCSIANVAPIVDISTVLRLYDLYNAHPHMDSSSLTDPHTSMMQVEDASNLSLEFLKQTCLAMHLRRREFLVQMLALRILNVGIPPTDSVYHQEWIQVQKEINHLAQEVENIALESTDILNDMLCKYIEVVVLICIGHPMMINPVRVVRN